MAALEEEKGLLAELPGRLGRHPDGTLSSLRKVDEQPPRLAMVAESQECMSGEERRRGLIVSCVSEVRELDPTLVFNPSAIIQVTVKYIRKPYLCTFSFKPYSCQQKRQQSAKAGAVHASRSTLPYLNCNMQLFACMQISRETKSKRGNMRSPAPVARQLA